jgi:hypothetical protein
VPLHSIFFLYSPISRKARVCHVTKQGDRDEEKKKRVNEEIKRTGKSRRNRYEEKDKREELKREKTKKNAVLLLHLYDCHVRITSLHKNAGSHCCGIQKRFYLARPRRCLVHHMLFFTH